jgi:hypothetical protein
MEKRRKLKTANGPQHFNAEETCKENEEENFCDVLQKEFDLNKCTRLKLVVEVKKYRAVWFNENSIANIILMSEVERSGHLISFS